MDEIAISMSNIDRLADDCLSRASNGEVIFEVSYKEGEIYGGVRDVISIVNYMDTLDTQNYFDEMDTFNKSYFVSEIGGKILRFDSELQNKLKEKLEIAVFTKEVRYYIGSEVQVEIERLIGDEQNEKQVYYLNFIELQNYVESYGGIELVKMDSESTSENSIDDMIVWSMSFKQMGQKKGLNRIVVRRS